uniref:Uncharacterized protein n=1 Tax=Leersia perrieri TaxID=77586 RepID=A0A0D9XMS8_9ORYZ
MQRYVLIEDMSVQYEKGLEPPPMKLYSSIKIGRRQWAMLFSRKGILDDERLSVCSTLLQ